MTENEKYLYDHFLISIKSGFESLEDIIEGAIEFTEEEGWQREISEEWIRDVLTNAYKKNEELSRSWNKDTHTKKLVEVFDSLCKKKIIAVHNIGNDDSEALYDIEDIWNELEDAGINPIGYCYYHGSDLEQVFETGELLIGFGGVKSKNEKKAIAIGNVVADALKSVGFEIDWNHTATGRIRILNFNWQNVFSSDEDVEKNWGHDKVFDLMN